MRSIENICGELSANLPIASRALSDVIRHIAENVMGPENLDHVRELERIVEGLARPCPVRGLSGLNIFGT